MKANKQFRYFYMKHFAWILPLSTILIFAITYIISRSATVSSIAGLLVGFFASIILVMNAE